MILPNWMWNNACVNNGKKQFVTMISWFLNKKQYWIMFTYQKAKVDFCNEYFPIAMVVNYYSMCKCFMISTLPSYNFNLLFWTINRLQNWKLKRWFQVFASFRYVLHALQLQNSCDFSIYICSVVYHCLLINFQMHM